MRTPTCFGFVLLSLGCFCATTSGQPVVSIMNPVPAAAVAVGQPVTLSVSATGAALTYQWRMNGVDLPAATNATYTMIAGATNAGGYAVVVSGGGGATTTSLGTLTVMPTDARLMNLSARGMAGVGANAMITGFVSSGDAAAQKTILLRGMGPGMAGLMGGMMSTVLGTPVLTVYDGHSLPIGMNMGWANAPTSVTGAGTSPVAATMMKASTGMMSALGAFAPAAGSADCALLMTAPAGLYSATVTGANGTSGVALAECYDADAANSSGARLINMSARANVGSGNAVLIAGFVIGAGASGSGTTVLVRAMGPGLTMLGLAGVLTNPVLTLYDANSKPIATNTGWQSMPVRASGGDASPVQAGIEPATSAVMTRVGAFGPMAGSADCAMVATLPPGSYSAVVSPAPGSTATGVCLVEVYELR